MGGVRVPHWFSDMELAKELSKETDITALANLIHSRLLGADLEQPYSLQAGEAPEDAIIEYVRQNAEDKVRIALFNSALLRLIRQEKASLSDALDLLDEHPISESGNKQLQLAFSDERLLYSFRMATLMQETDLPILSDRRIVFYWILLIYGHIEDNQNAAALFGHLMPCIGPIIAIRMAEIRTFCIGAIEAEVALAPILRALAQWDFEFLQAQVLPTLFERVTRSPNGEVGIPKSLSKALWQMINTPAERGLKEELANRICALMLKRIDSENSGLLHCFVFDLLLSVGFVEHALKFDNDYWHQKFERAGSRLEISQEWLIRRSQEYSFWNKTRPPQNCALVIGVPRFSEAAYLILFGQIIEDLLKLKVTMEPLGWSQMPLALREGKINIAIHNGVDSFHDQTLVRSNEYLFTFVGYEMIVHRKWARERLVERQKSGTTSPLLISALTDQPFEASRTIDTSAKDELIYLLQTGRLGLPGGTDIEVRIREFCTNNGIDLKQFSDMDEDTGLEKLLKGEIDLYVGGANQAFYAVHHFQSHCAPLLKLKMGEQQGTPNKLFGCPNFKEIIGIPFEVFVNLWFEMVSLWKSALDSSGLQIKTNLSSRHLREQLVMRVNELSKANFWDFDELAFVLQNHSILYERDVQGYAAIANQMLQKVLKGQKPKQ